MERVTKERLKNIQLDILQHVHEFCIEHDISYFLDSGTLLGAIRHKGYIPWDDDIDIGMLRKDYDKFLKIFNEENDRYKCYSVENNEDFCYPYAKVLDTNTTLYEPNETGNKLCINIDVLVYDNAPKNFKNLKKMYDKRDFYSNLNIIRCYNTFSKKTKMKYFVLKILHLGLKVFKKNFFVKKMVKNSKKYLEEETGFIGNFMATVRILCEKEIFRNFIEVEFEGKKYKAPIEYDKWLTSFYGDYMQLPPESKRVSHHKFVAYLNDI